ncbi:MAG: rhodanese-like domain-containing protein, partial [Chitinispirillaceae bacterium]|nr:rhodanese-like domain-containing protein [Chitinispirillaceae bacterium]
NVVIYCQSGNRAGRAIAHLDSLGYTNLHNAGGFTSGFFGGWNGSRIPKSQVLSNDSLPKYSMTASTAVAVSRKLGAFRKEASVSNRLAINTLHGLNISAVNSGKAFTLKGQRLYP